MTAVKIEAFTFEYNELQDRIRMSGNAYNNAAPVHLWLTRRLALRLLNSAVELIEKTSASIAQTPIDHRAAMALFEHENAQAMTQSLIETTSKPLLQQHTVSEEIDTTTIINRLDISFKKTNYQLSFFVSSQDTVVATAIVDYNQLHQILSLIHKGALALEWGVAETLFSVPEQAKATLQ
jgi:hypothetical protein